MSDQEVPTPEIKYKTGTPVAIVKAESIKLPEWSAKEIENTGTGDTAESFAPGIINYGSGEADIYYLATQNAAIKALRNVPSTFVVTYPNGQVDTWSGWITNFGVEIPIKTFIKVKIKFRASTDVVSSGTVTGTVTVLGLGTTMTITSS